MSRDPKAGISSLDQTLRLSQDIFGPRLDHLHWIYGPHRRSHLLYAPCRMKKPRLGEILKGLSWKSLRHQAQNFRGLVNRIVPLGARFSALWFATFRGIAERDPCDKSPQVPSLKEARSAPMRQSRGQSLISDRLAFPLWSPNG